MTRRKPFSMTCPIPIADYPRVLLAHGGGGRLMRDLIEKMFISAFDNEPLRTRHDSAQLDLAQGPAIDQQGINTWLQIGRQFQRVAADHQVIGQVGQIAFTLGQDGHIRPILAIL